MTCNHPTTWKGFILQQLESLFYITCLVIPFLLVHYFHPAPNIYEEVGNIIVVLLIELIVILGVIGIWLDHECRKLQIDMIINPDLILGKIEEINNRKNK